MKIHVVQKGETLWKISQKYGVDFDELKKMNTQLSNPEMIMPGMKIKVPSTTKQVKKEKPLDKEKKKDTTIKTKKDEKKDQIKAKQDEKKEQIKKPFKDTSEKAKPVLKEDDSKKPKTQKLPMQPIDLPKMPMMEKDYDFEKTSVSTPKVPQSNKVKKEEEALDTNQMPMQTNYPTQQPMVPYQQPMMPVNQAPIMPMYYPTMPSNCCGGSKMNQVPYAIQPQHYHPTPAMDEVDNITEDYPTSHGGTPYPNFPFNEQDLMESSSSQDMPQMPEHLAGVYQGENVYPQQPNYGYTPAPQSYPTIQPGYAPQQPMPNYPPVNYPMPMNPGMAPMNYPGYLPVQQPFYPQTGAGFNPGTSVGYGQQTPYQYGTGQFYEADNRPGDDVESE